MKATNVFSTAVWITLRASLFLALVVAIRPAVIPKDMNAPSPETTLFYVENTKQAETEATEVQQRVQKETPSLKEKRTISEYELLRQMSIEEKRELLEEGEILWAPTQGEKYLETEQFKRIKEEEEQREKARLTQEKRKEDTIKKVFWLGVLTVSPALIFASLVAIIRPKPRQRGRTVGL